VTTRNPNTEVKADDLAALLIEHKAITEAEKSMKARKDEIASIIRERAGNAVSLTVGGIVVATVPFRTNTNVRAEVVKTLAPEVYEAALTTTPYRPLLHTKRKD
jgi:hypothetical protein